MVKTQAYTLTYVASPDKTYVIEPKGGEIDYELAHKNPLKFYDNVMNQDIQEHSCAKKGGKRSPLKYSSILTKRAISRVLFVIEIPFKEMFAPAGFELIVSFPGEV